MKKITLFLFVLFCVESASGQIFRERQRNSFIGIRAGYSIAGWRGLAYDYPDLTHKVIPGFHAGFFVSVRIADNFTIEPGAYYSVKGWEVDGTIDDPSGTVEGTFTNKISYLDAPIMFRIFLKGLNFGVGPQVSMPFRSDLDFNGSVNGQPLSSEAENTVDLNDFDVAVALSIGYEFDFGLSLHATYDVGLTDAHATSPYPDLLGPWTEAKNRVVKFSVSFVLY